MSVSHIDNINVFTSLKSLLGIRGVKEAPTDLNTDQVQTVADLSMGGFNGYDIKTLIFNQNIHLARERTINVWDPAANPEHRDKEVRILALETICEIAFPTPDENLSCGVSIANIVSSGMHVHVVSWQDWYKTTADRRGYHFNINGLGSLKNSNNGTQPASNWNKWVPANFNLRITLRNEDHVFALHDYMIVRCVLITKPKYSYLPS